MAQETGKAVIRRGFDRRYIRYLSGHGIDIGAGDDPLGAYKELFPLMASCRAWDKVDGDAELMEGVADEAFDFVNSSHCLEHLDHPSVALRNWIRICKPGGHILIMVPDEMLYEHGIWPSTWAGAGHRWSFAIGKSSSMPASIGLLDFLQAYTSEVDVLKIELLDAGYLYQRERFDQTRTITGECAIEVILRKHA